MLGKLAFVLLILGFYGHTYAKVVKSCDSNKHVTVNCNCGTHSRMLMALLISMNHKLKNCLAHNGNGKLDCKGAVPKNCQEVLECGHKASGVYTINPGNGKPFKVYCDQKKNGGGWTVIQRRQDGSVDFYRGWNSYKIGFGDLNGEFWLGLDKIHRLTHQTRNKLRVDLEDTKGNQAYAEYQYFSVASERFQYKLHVGSYSGTAGDSLSVHNNMKFSTKDRDNDISISNCAKSYKGGWWYQSCHSSNLNGLYLLGKHKSYANGVNWYTWKGYHYSAKRADMKIKPVS